MPSGGGAQDLDRPSRIAYPGCADWLIGTRAGTDTTLEDAGTG
jgi:hypothetical protein